LTSDLNNWAGFIFFELAFPRRNRLNTAINAGGDPPEKIHILSIVIGVTSLNVKEIDVCE